jgi:protein-tyrosine-phosphatase
MLIAREKRKENIAEYILYMWQVEDSVRACQFNIDLIDKYVISLFKETEKVKAEFRDWYADIILMMYEEGIKEVGHMKLVKKLVDDLKNLHQKLINDKKDPKYVGQYNLTVQNLRDFGKKLGSNVGNEVEICLSALYALLLLRLQKKEVSRETLEAMHTFSNLMALLSNWYKKIELGEVKL